MNNKHISSSQQRRQRPGNESYTIHNSKNIHLTSYTLHDPHHTFPTVHATVKMNVQPIKSATCKPAQRPAGHPVSLPYGLRYGQDNTDRTARTSAPLPLEPPGMTSDVCSVQRGGARQPGAAKSYPVQRNESPHFTSRPDPTRTLTGPTHTLTTPLSTPTARFTLSQAGLTLSHAELTLSHAGLTPHTPDSPLTVRSHTLTGPLSSLTSASRSIRRTTADGDGSSRRTARL